ncbi:MAG: hypothetical protein FWE07_02465 [Turicibacter sp.]|nr:hypothetical protein [Turicibacter sp.]
MNELTQRQKDAIAQSYVNFKDRGILVLAGISGKAFKTFKKRLVEWETPIDDEELVLFKDLTWLGGGEEGILITHAHFYYYQWRFKQIAIADIAEIKIGGLFDENIVFVLKNGQSVSIWLAKLFSEVKEVIEILQSVDEPEQKKPSASSQVQCLGCRAIVLSHQNFCEYCRSPLS